MAFTQQTFLGASITNFNASMGWGDSISTCTINLVEDPVNGDSFDPVDVGTPILFEYDGWEFYGLVQSYKTNKDTSGNPTYTVILNDPREILQGVQLILGDYAGTVNAIPNLLNIYGYLEDRDGFGGAGRNDAGIPWINAKDGLLELVDLTSSIYGGPISIAGHTYNLNLNELPSLSDYYRIGSSSMTMMEYIKEICDAASYDYFFTLLIVGTGNTIVLKTVNRNVAPTFGLIDEFINNVDGQVSSEGGFEFQNNATGKFLSGAPVSNIYIQNASENVFDEKQCSWEVDNDSPLTQNIWPFWGFDDTGNVILAQGFDTQHRFSLPSKHITTAGTGDLYPTSLGEILSVIEGKESWILYLSEQTTKYYLPLEWVNYAVYNYVTKKFDTITYDDSSCAIDIDRNPNTPVAPGNAKSVLTVMTDINAANIAVVPLAKQQFFKPPLIQEGINGLKYESTAGAVLNKKPPFVELINYNNEIIAEYNETVKREDGGNLASVNIYGHNCIRNPHFGKIGGLNLNSNFIPESSVSWSSLISKPGELTGIISKNKIEQAQKINDSFDPLEWGHDELYAFLKGYADEYLGKKFLVKIETLVSRDSETGDISLSVEPDDSGYIEESLWDDAVVNNLLPLEVDRLTDTNNKIQSYVRLEDIDLLDLSEISKDDIILSIDGNTAFIKCSVDPNIVFLDKDNLLYPRAVITIGGKITYANSGTRGIYFYKLIKRFYKKVTNIDSYPSVEAYNKAISLLTSRAMVKLGVDILLVRLYNKQVITPTMAAIPLKSNIETYGPWYSSGANGKLEYEQDEGLAPWSFGGFSVMNQAANARVNEAISNYQISEAGSVTFPGVPRNQLGSQLLSGGPYVTNIQVNIGQEGVTSSYQMNTWTPNPYGTDKNNIDRITKISKQQQLNRKNFRLMNKKTEKNKSIKYKKPETKVTPTSKQSGEKSGTSYMIIGGQQHYKTSTDSYTNTVVIQPHYDSMRQIHDDTYKDTAMASLDTIFTPFSTNSGLLYGGSGVLPHFETATNTSDINVTNLNPFGSGSNFGFMLNDSGLPNSLSYGDANFDDMRGLALRGPVIVAGWGYNTDNNPVPNELENGSSSNFASGYLTEPNNWKCGPIDLKWEEERKLWITGGSNVKIVSIIDSGNFPTGRGPKVYSGQVYTITQPSSGDFTEGDSFGYTIASGEILPVLNIRPNFVLKDTYYIARQLGKHWLIDNQNSFVEDVQ